MATQAELATQLSGVKDQLVKVGTEIDTLQTKVADLQAAIANAGNVTPELQAAFDALKTQAQVLDDLNPDPTP